MHLYEYVIHCSLIKILDQTEMLLYVNDLCITKWEEQSQAITPMVSADLGPEEADSAITHGFHQANPSGFSSATYR